MIELKELIELTKLIELLESWWLESMEYYKENGIDRLEVVELTELMEFKE